MSSIEKVVKFNEEAKLSIVNGITDIAKAVKITLGASGKNVMFSSPFMENTVTKDGVTVAKQFKANDEFEDMGVKMIQDIAKTTSDEAGDGTTTATVLAESIINHGVKYSNHGFNTIDLKRGLDKAFTVFESKVIEKSVPIKNREQIQSVAKISANNDSVIGDVITECIEKSGTEGDVIIREGDSEKDVIEVETGMKMLGSYVSESFTNDKRTSKAKHNNPFILIYRGKIFEFSQIAHICEYCVQETRPLIIIADTIEGQALQSLVLNFEKEIINVCAVDITAVGTNRTDILNDIACYTGATIINDSPNALLSFTPKKFGSCEMIEVGRNNVTFINGNGTEEELTERKNQISAFIEEYKGEPNSIRYAKERLLKLSGGIVILWVGGKSKIEIAERTARFVDSLNATRCAIVSGIIDGGGVALFNTSIEIESEFKQGKYDEIFESESEKVGFEILIEATKSPISTIIENADKSKVDIVKEKIIEGSIKGYDARKRTYVVDMNMIEYGIIDPTKVTLTALKNAVSISGTVLTTECAITYKINNK